MAGCIIFVKDGPKCLLGREIIFSSSSRETLPLLIRTTLTQITLSLCSHIVKWLSHCAHKLLFLNNSPTVHTSGSPSAHTSGSPSAHTSDSPTGHTSGSPSVHTSSSPSVHTSGSPSAHTSRSPSAHTNNSPSAHTSGSPSAHTSGSLLTATSCASHTLHLTSAENHSATTPYSSEN